MFNINGQKYIFDLNAINKYIFDSKNNKNFETEVTDNMNQGGLVNRSVRELTMYNNPTTDSLKFNLFMTMLNMIADIEDSDFNDSFPISQKIILNTFINEGFMVDVDNKD